MVHTHPRSTVAECCRAIRTNLTFMGAGDPLEVLLITSPGPREGKTTLAVSLAITMAQTGRRVLIIDTDLRRPRLHKVFGVAPVAGITSVLVGERSFEECVFDTGIPGVTVMPCGPIAPNPSELLHTPQFTEIIRRARASYDRVIFDSPPLGAVTDPAVIAPQVQGVVLVVRPRQTSRDAVLASLKQLNDVGARLLGSVFNHVDPIDRPYGYRGAYYYYYHYGYGQGSDGGNGHDKGGSGGEPVREPMDEPRQVDRDPGE
jgi:capsular exopolysaccharide synthesis family protein